jgi:hypothetical protein
MKSKGVVFLTIFTLFWTALVGAFDYMIGLNLSRSIRALNYAETSGTVISSEVTRRSGSKGRTHSRGRTHYGVAIRYRYEVGGVQREANLYRYSALTSSSDSKWAYSVVQGNPAGAVVKVYYDPARPDHAVLSRGVNGGDLFILLFMTPFNVVMLGLWSIPLGALVRKTRQPVAGGVKWSTNGRVTRVRLPRFSPLISALAGTGGMAFASIFVLAFGFGGNPPLAVAVGTLALAVGVGAGVGSWQWVQQHAGKADLVIDELERTVELPATLGRKQRRTVPWSAISGVTVDTLERRGSKGGTSRVYAVMLQCQGAGEKLAEWQDEGRAQSLADWLGERLKSGEPAAPPRKTTWNDSMPVRSGDGGAAG